MALTNHIVPDSPTNNFATLNPLNTNQPTISNGNLQWSQPSTNYRHGLSTIAISPTGKYIVEALFTTTPTNSNYNTIGVISDAAFPFLNTSLIGSGRGLYGINDSSSTYGQTFIENGVRQGSITVSSGTIIQVLIDRDNNELTFTKNGTLQTGTGSTVTLPSDVTLWFVVGDWGSTGVVNFGQDPTFDGNTSPSTTYPDANGIGQFHYQPPTGALALCTANLPDFTPTVTDDTPQDYFKAVLYAGNGGTQSITSVGFQPDLVWIKTRNVTANHALFDSTRGVGNVLQPNTTLDAQTDNDTLTSFDSNGFSLGNATGSYITNTSTYTFVAWCWKAGGAPDLTSSPTKPFAKNGVQYETLSAANITAGTITPTAMSVNTDAGFSIVKYTGSGISGSTFPHGLSSPPEFVIFKALDDINNWTVITPLAGSLSSGTYLFLNSPQEAKTSTDFNAMALNVSTITLDTSTALNSTFSYIAYCWHSVEGYSKFGSYTGNGSPDGTFVYCGFRPGFVMIKETGNLGNWHIYDIARPAYNPAKYLLANEPDQEGGTIYVIDNLSNGFKIRNNGNGTNRPSGNFIFMAFAEQPFKYSNAR